MKDYLISEFNKYQSMYLAFMIEGNIDGCFICVDISWFIFEILHNRYNVSEDEVIRVSAGGIYTFRL